MFALRSSLPRPSSSMIMREFFVADYMLGLSACMLASSISQTNLDDCRRFEHLCHESRDAFQLTVTCTYSTKNRIEDGNSGLGTRYKTANLCHENDDTSLTNKCWFSTHIWSSWIRDSNNRCYEWRWTHWWSGIRSDLIWSQFICCRSRVKKNYLWSFLYH